MVLADLGDGLIVRYPTAADEDELAAFNAEMHGAPGPPHEGINVWTRDLLVRPHPTFTPQDFTVIEDTRTKRIISSLNLISQTWTYGGIPFGVGQVEIVATNPDFNRLSLRSNVVLRWEWVRGSTFFLIWQQNRQALTPVGDLVRAGSLWDAATTPGDNFIAVKITYWIAAR